MPAGTDLVKKALDVQSYTEGALGKASAAFDVAGIVTADNKFKAITSTLKSLVAVNLLGWGGQVSGVMFGIRAAITGVVRDSGSLEAALRRVGEVRVYTNQFAPFLGSVTAARQRVGELLKESGKGFNFSDLAPANHALEVLTKGALSTGTAWEDLKGRTAAAGQDLQEVSGRVGALYAGLRDGKPVQEVAMELAHMGIISEQTARRIEQMQASGAGSSQAIDALRADLHQAGGAAALAAQGMDMLDQRYAVAKENLKAGFGTAFLASERQGLTATIAVMEALAPVAVRLGNALSLVVTFGANLGTRFVAWAASLPGFTSALTLAGQALIALGTAIAVISTASTLFAAALLVPGIFRWIQALTSGAVASNLATIGAQRLTQATLLQASAAEFAAQAAEAQAAGETILAAELNAAAASATRQAVAQTALGGASAVAASGLAALTTGLRAMLVALVTNPITLVVLAIAAIATVAYRAYESQQELARGMKELKDAGDEATSSLMAQANAMRDMDDQQQALIDSTNRLVEARTKLAELVAKGADSSLIEKAQQNVQAVLAQQTAIQNKRGLAPGREETELNQRRAKQRIDLQEGAYQAQLSLARPNEQLRLRDQRIASEDRKIDQGQTLVSERVRVDGLEKGANVRVDQHQRTLDAYQKQLRENPDSDNEDSLIQGIIHENAELKKAQKDRDSIRKNSSSDIIAGGARVDEDEKKGKITHDEANRRRADLEARRYDLEDKLDSRVQNRPQLLGEQAQAIQSRIDSIGRNTVADSLQRIGGGGGASGGDPGLDLARRRTDLLAEIKELLARGNKDDPQPPPLNYGP